MSLSGLGVIAIWNDIAEEGRANFYEWHDREHIPERVGIPGFLRGRRYIALSGTPEYFTLYEVRDGSVLTGPDYLARLNSPTEWTSRSVQHFRNTSRSLCNVEVSLGAGSGGFIGTIRFNCEFGRDAELLRRGCLSPSYPKSQKLLQSARRIFAGQMRVQAVSKQRNNVVGPPIWFLVG